MGPRIASPRRATRTGSPRPFELRQRESALASEPAPDGGSAQVSRTIRIVAALVLAGTALRTQALIVGPLVGNVQADLAMSHGIAGLLSTIPVLCMGFLAPLGPVLAGSVGPRMGTAICILFIAAFGVLRAFLPDAATVLLAT